jgi:hypothetical protein
MPLRRVPSRKRPSARATLMWGVFFAALLHAGLLVAYFAEPALSDPVYAHRSNLLHRRIREAAADRPYTVIMFGTSHVVQGFDARQIEQAAEQCSMRRCVAFNFSFPWFGPITERLYLRRLLREGIKPDFVLIEVQISTLNEFDGRLTEANGLTPEKLSLEEWPEALVCGYSPEQLREWRTRISCNPWGELRLQLLSRLFSDWFPEEKAWSQIRQTDEAGFRKRVTELPPERRKIALDRSLAEYSRVMKQSRPHPESVAALHKLLAECRSQGIRVALVTMPESSEFRAGYDRGVKREMEQLIDSLCAEFGVKWIDAREWCADDTLPDGHHLNHMGAAEFTNRLARTAIVPALTEGEPPRHSASR